MASHVRMAVIALAVLLLFGSSVFPVDPSIAPPTASLSSFDDPIGGPSLVLQSSPENAAVPSVGSALAGDSAADAPAVESGLDQLVPLPAPAPSVSMASDVPVELPMVHALPEAESGAESASLLAAALADEPPDPPAVPVSATPEPPAALLPPPGPPVRPVYSNAVTSAQILANARSALGIPYFLGANTTEGIDCSAYISNAWGISWHTTETLSQVASPISKSELQPGDALNLPMGDDPRGLGHMRLFAGWANGERTQMWVYEATPPQSVYHIIPYDARFTPMRRVNFQPASNAASAGDSARSNGAPTGQAAGTPRSAVTPSPAATGDPAAAAAVPTVTPTPTFAPVQLTPTPAVPVPAGPTLSPAPAVQTPTPAFAPVQLLATPSVPIKVVPPPNPAS